MRGLFRRVTLCAVSLKQTGTRDVVVVRSGGGRQVAHTDILAERIVLLGKTRGLLVHQREIPRLERLHTELGSVAGLLIGRLGALLPNSARLQLQ